MLRAQTVWVTRSTANAPAFDAYTPEPLADEPSAEILCLTNDPMAFEGLLPTTGHVSVLDAMALYALAHPAAPVERADQLIVGQPPSGAALWQVWQDLDACLDRFPLWALKAIEAIMRKLGEHEMERLIGHYAARARGRPEQRGAWHDGFKISAARASRRGLPTHADCAPLDVPMLAACLRPGGALACQMANYELRAGQVAMLEAVAQAFNAGRHLLAEAGTGVGKSLAYLIPAAAWACQNDLPVIISSHTRNLQTQLVEKDLPCALETLSAAWGATCRVALLKGRSNYLCLRQFGLLLDYGQGELDRAEQRQFAEAISWAVQTQDGDLDTFAGAGRVDPGFLSRLSSQAEECAGRACRRYRRCFLQQARARAAAAHVVIANHALVFSDLQTPGSALPPYAQVIFDEAHNLEEAATRHFSVEASLGKLAQLARRVSRGRGKRAGGALDVLRRHLDKGALATHEGSERMLRERIVAIRDALDHAQDAGQALFSRLGALVRSEGQAARFRRGQHGERLVCREGTFVSAAPWVAEDALATDLLAFKQAIGETVSHLLDLAKALRENSTGELDLYGDQAENVEGLAVAWRDFALNVDFVLAASDPEHVFWVEPVGNPSAGQIRLLAAPLSIAAAMADQLYARKTSVIFCSATLRVGSSFAYMAQRLGLDRLPSEQVATCVAESPFDYLRKCAALAPTFLPELSVETSNAYAEQLSALMVDVFTRTRGRAMGLFTSYEMLNQVARLIEAPLAAAGIRLLIQGGRLPRDQITRLFRNGGACVLLGAQSFWEGVDVMGEALSCVVMARLPFAAVGDPILEARSERIDREGGSAFREYALPQAVIRFRQGFGRLIRSRSDQGVVIVADRRVMTRHYGAIFRKSLPCPVHAVADRDDLLARIDALVL